MHRRAQSLSDPELQPQKRRQVAREQQHRCQRTASVSHAHPALSQAAAPAKPVPALQKLRQDIFQVSDRAISGTEKLQGFQPSKNVYELEAEFEVDLWFDDSELVAYKRSDEDVMFEHI